jgi:tetratricopeptide (TPR) repeat protein
MTSMKSWHEQVEDDVARLSVLRPIVRNGEATEDQTLEYVELVNRVRTVYTDGASETKSDNLVEVLQRALKRFPSSADLTLQLAEAMNPYGDRSGNHPLMRRAIRLYEESGRFAEAQEVRSKLASDLFFEGVEAMGQDDQSAENQFKKAIRTYPLHADSYVHLGMIYENRGDWKLAVKFYLRGMQYGRIACHEKEVWNRWSGSFSQDSPDLSKTHYWGELETRPFLRALYCLSSLCYRRNEFERALRYAQESLYLNPNDNTGVRYIAYSILRFRGEDGELTKLKAEYEDLDSEANELERKFFGRTLETSGKDN